MLTKHLMSLKTRLLFGCLSFFKANGGEIFREETLSVEKVDGKIFYALDPKNQDKPGVKDLLEFIANYPESPCICLYLSQAYLKRGRLPDLLHNSMLAHAIKDPKNKSVKRYFKYKKVKSA